MQHPAFVCLIGLLAASCSSTPEAIDTFDGRFQRAGARSFGLFARPIVREPAAAEAPPGSEVVVTEVGLRAFPEGARGGLQSWRVTLFADLDGNGARDEGEPSSALDGRNASGADEVRGKLTATGPAGSPWGLQAEVRHVNQELIEMTLPLRAEE